MKHFFETTHRRKLFNSIFLISFLSVLVACSKPSVIIVTEKNAGEKVLFGVERLKESLLGADYAVNIVADVPGFIDSKIIIVGQYGDFEKNDVVSRIKVPAKKEAFAIKTFDGSIVALMGNDESGTLYGCLELAEIIKNGNRLPNNIDITDSPEMVLRGTCIGLQKTTYLSGRQVYEYPYTPESFPWFYDKELWVRYLDMMVENRYNSLYLWNGHPFASLVKLNDYPFAVEVDDVTFQKNEEIFVFLTEEANKRGIWVIQMFYNIIVSKPFAEHFGLKTQDRNRPILPLIADYTRKSISEFVRKYPNVGLMVCLGEAMNTIDDDVEWFTKTIIPGVQDGMKALGTEQEPPIVLRGHDTDAEQVMKTALPLYKNLYTMYKYNGESLTTYEPRAQWSEVPMALSKLGSVHISNVHILANLEPFRYGSPNFIKKSVKAMHELQGANGLHLYPQTSYWDWPYTADKTEPRTLQIDRDKLWYKVWGRYAWNVNRDEKGEDEYWSGYLAGYYGCNKTTGALIQRAYEEFGEIAPKLSRTFGISDGNRQTLLLGNFMSQLVNPRKWTLYDSFVESSGPEKELLIDYIRKEVEGEPHVGETPPQIIDEVVKHGTEAVEAIEKASKSVSVNTDEFQHLVNDIRCYNELALFYEDKVKAAEYVLHYKYSGNIADLEKAVPYLDQSLDHYVNLVDLTKDTYLYANSMQTQQRRVPISGSDGKNKTWEELLPHYQTEADNFKRNLEMLKSYGGVIKTEYPRLKPVEAKILTPGLERFPLKEGVKVYTDNKAKIAAVADELKELEGICLSDDKQRREGTKIRFKAEKAVKVVVGYFNTNSYSTLKPPTLETNANANDRGQADIKIANALDIPELYPVNVYTYRFDAGEQELVLGIGRVLILGFIDADTVIEIHDAGMAGQNGSAVDWLFY